MSLWDSIAGTPTNQLLPAIKIICDAIDAGGSGAGAGIDVSAFATAGDGTQATPWIGWDTAITWSPRTEYHFKSGWFAYGTSPNFLQEDIALRGEAGTYLKHTGIGDSFIMDSGAPGVLWVQRVRMENFTIVGNFSVLSGTGSAAGGTNQVVGVGTSFLSQVAIGDAVSFQTGMNTESRIVTAIADNTHLTVDNNWLLTYAIGNAMRVGKTRHGMWLSGVRNGTFRNISIKDIAHDALHSEFCVTNTAEDFVCTYHEPTQSTGFVIRPQNGIVLDSGATTTWTFIEPVLEGTQMRGFWFKTDCYGNTIINGTSEGNKGKGAVIQSIGNTFIDTDFEANDDWDIDVLQSRNCFINCLASAHLNVSAGQGNQFIGGTYGNIVVDGDQTVLNGIQLNGVVTGVALTSLVRFPYVDTLDGGLRMDSRVGNVLDWTKDLASASTINTNARDARLFYWTQLVNVTLANPINGVNGQAITWRIIAGSNITVAYGNKFRMPASKDFVTVLGSGDVFYLTARYNSTDDKWDIVQANTDVFSILQASDISAQDINATGAFYVDDMQVLTNQQASIPNPDGTLAGATTTITSILTAMRNHGLVAITAPFNLANTIFYTEAQFLTYANNAKVKKWRERSGNGRHLAQSDPSKQPLFIENQINGLPCVRFDGINDFLISGAWAFNQAICISMVMKRYNNQFKYLYSSIDGAGIAMFQGDGTFDDKVSMYAGAGSGDPNGAIDSGAWYLATAEYNGSSSKIYENGVQVGGTGNPGANNGNGVILGNRWDLALPCQVDISAFVIYLTSERSNVETYLLSEYAL